MFLINNSYNEEGFKFSSTKDQWDTILVLCKKFDTVYDELMDKAIEIAKDVEYLVKAHPSYWGQSYLRTIIEKDGIFRHDDKLAYMHCYDYDDQYPQSSIHGEDILSWLDYETITESQFDTLVKFNAVNVCYIDDFIESLKEHIECLYEYKNGKDIVEDIRRKLEVSDRDIAFLPIRWVLSLGDPVLEEDEETLKPFISQEDYKRALDIEKWSGEESGELFFSELYNYVIGGIKC